MDSLSDYEPLTPARGRRPRAADESDAFEVGAADDGRRVARPDDGAADGAREDAAGVGASARRATRPRWLLRRGHALTFAGFLLFTVLVYFRPYELIPALSSLSTMTFWVALATLCLFVPLQLALEGNLTARPPEVNYLLLLCVMAVLSIPLAIYPAEAFEKFYSGFLKYALMFVVMVNVARTERRLRWLLVLALAVTVTLCVDALNNYRLGNLTVEGYRVKGLIGSMLENPNEMAIHLGTMMPLALALALGTRNPLKKMLFAACAVLTLATVVVTFSRGGFLGMVAAVAVLAWKLGRRNRLLVFAALAVVAFLFLTLAPGNYWLRLASMFDPSLDALGSSAARREVLFRSVLVALRHPLFGIGIGNFHNVSIRELETHNAYTQVAAEMGLIALLFYVRFLTVPLRRLLRIERETFDGRRTSHYYYLAVGLQASLASFMVSSFFGSVAYYWYAYYLVGYAVCLRRIYESEHGPLVDERDAKREAKRAARRSLKSAHALGGAAGRAEAA
jgi:putative inorganic carbon (HCO3(-)) transporter